MALYQDCNYAGGWSASFGVGSYHLSDITVRGGRNDDASSIRIPAGYAVTLYQDDNFTGTAVTLTGDNSCLVGVNFNDALSSMVVSTTGTPTPAPTPTPATGWGFCANENQTCRFSGTVMVRYGAGSSYVWKMMTDTAACNNATFGDPASGAAKHCDIALPTQAYESVADSMQTAAYNTYHSSYVTSGRVYGYWVQANGLESLTDAYLRTRSATYKQRMKDMLNGIYANNGNSYLADFYDDEGWLAIATLRAYENTGDAAYLNAANILWTDMKTGQHPERNGILQWKKGLPGSFNAIQNSLATIFTARLYRVTGDASLLQTAKNIHAWLKANLVDPANGAVWDGYDATNNTTNKAWIFSYNIGTYIGASLELYKITGDVAYYNDAVKSAEYAMTNRLTNGVFFTNETGQGDGGMFKGVFVRYLALFAREGGLPAATRARYENAIRSSMMAMVNQGMVQSTQLVGPVWTVKPTSTPDFSTEMSGVFLAEAAATLDRVFFYKDVNYGGYQSAFTPGSYTMTQLNAKGVLNDDITSLTIPSGVTVTAYQDDNFAGASATFTSSTGWLASWNDKITSVRIAQ